MVIVAVVHLQPDDNCEVVVRRTNMEEARAAAARFPAFLFDGN